MTLKRNKLNSLTKINSFKEYYNKTPEEVTCQLNKFFNLKMSTKMKEEKV